MHFPNNWRSYSDDSATYLDLLSLLKTRPEWSKPMILSLFTGLDTGLCSMGIPVMTLHLRVSFHPRNCVNIEQSQGRA